MKHALLFVVLLTAALGAAACNGDGGKPAGPTPRAFDEVRGELVDRLDTIKVNIASVPADIKTRIKSTCRELQSSIGKNKTAEICDTLDEALGRSDPGRIDRVLAELAQLQP